MYYSKRTGKDGINMDHIIKGMALGNEVRYFAMSSKDIAEHSRKIHGTSPICTAALGRLLTAGALMGTMQKNDGDLITLRINCEGPAKGLTVTADNKGNVKGIIYNPLVMLPPNAAGHLNVGGALGQGILSVIRDTGGNEPYVGQTILVTSEIAEDLTYYFAESEQIPTSVGLGVLMNRDNTVDVAGGFIIQMMPFASEESIKTVENGLAEFGSVTEHLGKGESVQEMMQSIFGDDMTVEEDIPAGYKCNCSREKVTKALISIGEKEIKSMIEDGEDITMNCEFCESHYTFTVDELKLILEHGHFRENLQPQ